MIGSTTHFFILFVCTPTGKEVQSDDSLPRPAPQRTTRTSSSSSSTRKPKGRRRGGNDDFSGTYHAVGTKQKETVHDSS